MLHNKPVTYRETLERSPLQLVLGLTNTSKVPRQNPHEIKPNYKKTKRKLSDTLGRINQKPKQIGMLFGPKLKIHSGRIPEHCDRSQAQEVVDYVQTQ